MADIKDDKPATRPPPLYIPRAVSDLMLALQKNSTSVYYRCGDVCVKHQAVLDREHLQICDQFIGFETIADHLQALRTRKLCDIEPPIRNAIIRDFEALNKELIEGV